MNLTRSLLILLAAAGIAGAQPPKNEPPRDPQRDPQRESQKENDPAAMKARLERWLEETRHREEIITAALKKLSEGASPEDVRKSMEPGTRPQRGGGGGGNGGPGGRDAPPGWSGGPPGRNPMGMPHEPGGGRPLDREQVLAFIEKQSPEFAARMRAMAKESPEIADRILSRLTPQISEIMAERDDQLREIRTSQLKNGWEVLGAARDIRDATKASDAAARAKGIERMRTLLGTGFDLRLRLHEREAAVLEERLAKLKGELVEERTGREAFISERLKMATEPRERREPKLEGKPEGKPGPKPAPKP